MKKSRLGQDSLILVPPQEAPAIWPHIEVFLQEALRFGGGKLAAHHWLARVLSVQADLFVASDLKCAAICEKQFFPLRNVYAIILLGGEGGHDWDAVEQTFEAAAKIRECDCLEIYGRPGWRSILKELGYETAHHVWRKELE